jgi:sec-independent protein translocase protein TatB
MPSFQDSAVLVLLALLLFGPKKLPVLARQLGKLMADFRRASNEFRTQMEEELRISEQAERQKQVAALEASAPSTIAALPAETIPEPEHPHLPSTYDHEPLIDSPVDPVATPIECITTPEDPPTAIPIATAGELTIMPPATGLPVANGASSHTEHVPELETETLHG